MTASLVLPFSGNFQVTFKFGAYPRQDEIKRLYKLRRLKGHEGVDFGLPSGTGVLSCSAGIIEEAAENDDYGLCIIIRHRWGISLYGHLSEVKVAEGQRVKSGQIIGLSGASGFVTGPHLHFGIRLKGADLKNGFLGFSDPMPYFKNQGRNR